MDDTLRAARLGSLGDAVAGLESALAQPKTEWTRDAAIQRFEFSFELAWKAVSAFARTEGLEARSPREALRVAHRLAWIDDDVLWLRMIDDRNRTSHIYNEAVAEEIFARLGPYGSALGELRRRLTAVAWPALTHGAWPDQGACFVQKISGTHMLPNFRPASVFVIR